MQPVFDAAAWSHTFDVPGKGKITVRWPNDAEWLEHLAGRILRVRGEEADSPNGEQCDLALLAKIATGDVSAFDGGDASMMISSLRDSFRISDITMEPGGYVVEVQTRGGVCVVKTKTPNAKEAAAAQRKFSKRQELGRVAHIHINYAGMAAYFDTLFDSAEGYGAAGVPVIHKAAIVRAVIAEFESAFTIGFIGGPTTPATAGQ
jgi:hypothetical protein